MSGERSKSSGEFGEKIVGELLKLIGWGSADFNPSIDCIDTNHNRKSKKHGLDFIFSLESPLINHLQDDVLISVKHNAEKYPDYPTTKLKEYIFDLATSMECFPYDQKYSDLRVTNNIHEKDLSGVIFWISSKDEPEKDIIKEINNFRNTEKVDYGPIYLVDNNRANFLYRSIKYTKNKYDSYNFIYHSTGYNDNDPYVSKSYGRKLPVQLITTNLLPIRVDSNEFGPILLLFVNENFSEDSLKRIIGFAQRLTQSWAKKIVILYLDYLELDHLNIVQSSKRLFENDDFIKTVEVKSFKDTIPTLGEN